MTELDVLESLFPPELLRQFEEQYAALKARVAQSGLYAHEIAEFPAACLTYALVAERLGVVEDRGSLTSPESRNLVRRVWLGDGSDAVLKVIGNNREPGEATWLESHNRRGSPCPQPIAHGSEQVAFGGTEFRTTYLLAPFFDCPTMAQRAQKTIGEKIDLTRELTRLLHQFHNDGAVVPVARRWEERLMLHLMWTLPLVRRYALPEPKAWVEKLRALSAQGDVSLHGDPAAANVLDGAQEKLLIDPPGAIKGLPEADMAQICSQVGGPEDVTKLIDTVSATYPDLDRAKLSAFAGLNFLTWAGYFLADHAHPNATSLAESKRAAQSYLHLAGDLLEPYQLKEVQKGTDLQL